MSEIVYNAPGKGDRGQNMGQWDIRHYNCVVNEINAIYHNAALRMGISNSVQSILYVICENGSSCPQSEIYKQTGIRRQTINSAIRKLEQEGLVRLEPGQGRNTIVRLTGAGETVADRVARPILQIENEIFGAWTSEELRLYQDLTERYRDALKQKLEAL